MAYGRARRSTNYGEFWPGYVDVLFAAEENRSLPRVEGA